MKKIMIATFCLAAFAVQGQKDFTRYIRTTVGTDSEYILSHGNVLPFTARPWGMNHWTPQTAPNGEPWQYVYDAHQIVGLKQTHQPSPWGGDYAMFSLMPTVGERKFLEKDRQSWFSHKTEKAMPHYYGVYLAEHFVHAEMTPTTRACVMRFTFPAGEQSNVVIDAFDSASFIKVIPEQNKVVGYTTQYYHNGKRAPDNFKNYFVVYFNKPFSDFAVWQDDGFVSQSEVMAKRTGVVVTFSTVQAEQIEARIASSFISTEQAELNLKNEVGDKTFEQVVREGRDEWNSYLSRFEVRDNKLDDLDNVRMFYTALYRMFIYPRTLFEYDATGEMMHFSPFNGQVLPGYMYTDNGYWDTFRAARPFFDLFFPEWSSGYIESISNVYKESGWLPEWISPGHVDAMIGSNSASIIACAYLNGIKNIDIATLWEAMEKMAHNAHPSISSVGRYGIQYYERYGYIPSDVGITEEVARSLEYAYADWCCLKVAQALGKDKATIDVFSKRAQNYKNSFNPKVGLMSQRDSKGNFTTNFNPIAWNWGFTEGCSMHYSWSVFHDPKGLAALMGGDKAFVKKLDSVFLTPPAFDVSGYGGKVIHEVREMNIQDFGQYAHGNQPIQHMIYLYDWTSEPWKTQYWVRQVMSRLYSPTSDGYCGDEDNGQTSAWYVFSALGFYPVNPGTGEYAIGSPLFREVVVTLPDGKKLTISAPDNDDQRVYVNSLKLNGKFFDKNYLTIEQVRRGGQLLFDMTANPNTLRGVNEAARPYSMTDDKTLK
jgi:predicted alpha-1,2-mannosidase